MIIRHPGRSFARILGASEFPTEFWWRRGELNRHRNPNSYTVKVLDSPTKSSTFGHSPEDLGEPKTAQTDPNNPEKPDRVRSVKRNRRDE